MELAGGSKRSQTSAAPPPRPTASRGPSVGRLEATVRGICQVLVPAGLRATSTPAFPVQAAKKFPRPSTATLGNEPSPSTCVRPQTGLPAGSDALSTTAWPTKLCQTATTFPAGSTATLGPARRLSDRRCVLSQRPLRSLTAASMNLGLRASPGPRRRPQTRAPFPASLVASCKRSASLPSGSRRSVRGCSQRPRTLREARMLQPDFSDISTQTTRGCPRGSVPTVGRYPKSETEITFGGVHLTWPAGWRRRLCKMIGLSSSSTTTPPQHCRGDRYPGRPRRWCLPARSRGMPVASRRRPSEPYSPATEPRKGAR
jgi:hypothetical protein